MNLTGLFIGLFTLVAIGLGFLWVIKIEYHVGAHVAKAVGALGAAVVAVSLLMPGFYSSALIGVLGATIIWGAAELSDQERRVASGMFKKNPKKRPQKKEGRPT